MKIFYFIILIIFSYDVLSKEITILNDISGRGFEIINHSKVKVHYIGKLVDGKEFDNSYKRGEPITFQIGTRQVIQGWETGLIGMKIGGKRTILIPPELDLINQANKNGLAWATLRNPRLAFAECLNLLNPKKFPASGIHPTAVDMTAATLMGFNWQDIRLLKNSFTIEKRNFVPFQHSNIQVISNKEEWNGPLCLMTDWFDFVPHFGWVGAIERNNSTLSEK